MDVLILAGGKSSRMGGNHKGNLKIRGEGFTERLIRVMKPHAERILLSYGETVQQELHRLPREEGQTELDRLNAACANMEQATNLFALHHKRLQVSKQPVRVVRTSPAQQEEWYSTFARKLYYCYIADVRKEDGQYQLLSEQSVSYRPSRSIVVGPVHGSSLMWLGDAQ